MNPQSEPTLSPSQPPAKGEAIPESVRERLAQARDALLERIIEKNADGVVVVCCEGIIRFTNPAAEALFCREAAELVGSLFGVPLSDGETTEIEMGPGPNSGRVAEMRVVEIEWEGRPAYLASLRDITDRKRNEAAQRFLAEAGAVLAEKADEQALIPALARLAVTHLADWCLIDVREKCGTICRTLFFRTSGNGDAGGVLEHGCVLMFPAAPAGLARVFDGSPPELYGEVPAPVLESFSLQAPAGIRHAPPCRSLVVAPLVAHAEPLGALTVAVGAQRPAYDADDLSLVAELGRRAALALDNARLQEQCRDAVRQRDEFLAMLGHELRNPLAPIGNALSLLRAAPADPATVKEAEQIAARQLKHLTRLVDELLDVARVTSGKIRLRLEPVLLADAVRDAVEMVRGTVDANRHTLEVHMPSEELTVCADPARLTQILVNLLGNAAKYSPPEGHISLSARRLAEKVVIRVRDKGKGIPREFLPRVFELFSQSDQRLDRGQGGLGIGLALVRSLTELHGGRIEAFSDGPGQGSEFVLTLPLASAHSLAEQMPAAASPLPGPTPRRVLVVDDNRDAAESLAMLLRLHGHQVRVAHTGLDALHLAEQEPPEAILLDIGLPALDGYEVARRLRRLPALAKTVLVAVTGYGMEEDRQRAREAGFDRHLVKPADPAVVEQLLRVLPVRPTAEVGR